MSDPVVSVIICTRDRPQALLECVAAIAAAAERCPSLSVEIVVVENLSKPHLALDGGQVAQVARGRGRFLKLGVGGLSNARNAGMRAARGQFLVFTDDDCIMENDYFLNLAHYLGDPSAHLFLGGRVSLADPTDLPFTIKDDPEARTYDVGFHPGGFVPGCNFVLSRVTADALGDFDPRFGAGAPFRAGEDTDYIIRAHRAGIAILYVPDIAVQHHHGRKTLAEVEELSRYYSFANGALYGKHFGQGWLLKHLYWSLRSALRETFGGPPFDPLIGLTWSSVARANLSGLVTYLCDRRAARPAGWTSFWNPLSAQSQSRRIDD